MELTKEHFDTEIGSLNKRFDKIEVSMATKQDVSDAVEDLARIIATTVASPLQQHLDDCQDNTNLRFEVRSIKHEVTKIKSAIHLE